MHVDTEVRGLDRLGRRFESSSNRLAQSIIVSALLVSSSLVMNYEMEPRLWGVPVLGLAGYLFAGLIGIRMVVSMLKN